MPADQTDSRADARQSFYAKQQLIASAKLTFQQLAAVIKNATVYPAAHPFLLASVVQLLVRVNGFLATRREVAFYLVAGELFFETHSIPIDQGLSMLMEQFTSRDVGGIIFKPGILRNELVKLAELMNRDVASFAAEGGIIKVLEKEQITHIELHRVLMTDRKMGSALKEAKKRSGEIFMEAVDTVQEIIHSVHLVVMLLLISPSCGHSGPPT